ncbi:MAG: hypothetical protein MPN21_19555 [Thermoanaerobaculia bacterium]|nr:hypothetical protein [Thermoanaerobaculia bacterium]
MASSSTPSRLIARFLLAGVVWLLAAALAQAQPTLSKVFTPSTIGPGSVSRITFTITNGSGAPVTSLAFTDTLPAAVTIADPSAVFTSCDLGVSGTLTAPDGGSTITLSDAQIGAFQSCTVTVDVTSSTAGMHTNPAVTLSSSAGSSMSLPIDLTVATDRPGFSKSFSPSSVPLGGRSTLTLTVDNSLNASDLSSLVFTDVFPPGMLIADPANASTTCAGPNPMFTAVAGTNTVAFQSFGLLFPGFEVMLAGETCTTTVDVVADINGMLDNVTSELTTNVGSSGRASDTLGVTVTTLAIEKDFSDDPIPPGATVTLDFVIHNFDRDFSATGVAFTDDLNAALTGLTFDSLTSNTCGGSVIGVGTTTLGLTGGTVAAQGSCAIQATLTVPPTALPGAYVNTTGAVTGTIDGSPTVGNMASDTLFVEPAPVLTKTFIGDPVNPGDTVVLEFTVTNTSATSSATDIAFTDPLPNVLPTASMPLLADGCCGAGSTCTYSPLVIVPPPSDTILAMVTISGGTLEPAGMPGDSCTFSVTLDVTPAAPPGLFLNTTSEITATVDGATRTGEPATDTLEIVAAPKLFKEFSDDPVAPGDTVTLEFTLTHPADAPGAATNITFTDDLAPVVAGMTANLPPSPDPPCGAGSSLTGSVGDTLLTLMGGSLLPGEDCTFSVTLDVPVGAAAGTFTNTTSGVAATVSGVAATSAPASDDLTVTGLTLVKEFIDDPILPGEMVTLRFTLENISPTDDATSISFTDDLASLLPGVPDVTIATALPLPACGGTLSTLGGIFLLYSGGSVSQGDPPCSFDVVLNVPASTNDGSYSNTTGSLTAVIGGSVVVLDPATDFLTVASDFLTLSKEFTDDPVAPGDSVNLRFTLTNLDGAQSASAITFTDSLDAVLPGLVASGLPFAACGGTVDGVPDAGTISFSGGSLGPGATCDFDVSVDVPAAALAGDYGNLSSDVTGTINGFPVHGDPASDTLTVLNLLDFSKSFDGPTTGAGMATLTFTITNPGADTATGFFFSDDLDSVIPGLIATSLPTTPCGAGSSLTGISFLSFSGGELPPMGGMCSFDVEVLVPASATAGTFPNVTSPLFVDGLEVAPPATADLTIEPPPAFDKAFAPNAVGLGFTSVLTFTIDNTASSLAATDLDFTDNLPAGMVVATPSNASTTCAGGTLTAVAGSGVVTYTGGTVGAGATCTVQVDVLTTATGFLNNTSGDLTSSSGNSGTAQATLAVDPQPGFSKSFSPDMIAIGGVSTLTFTISNSAATSAATNLDFTDNLPANVVVATPSNASTTCTGGTLTAADGSGVITYTGGSVDPFSNCTVQVDVTSSTVGQHMNVSGALTSSLGNSGTASDTLTVNPPPGFSKSFAPNPSIIGGVVTLTFTVDNTASTASAASLAFTDNLPAALVVATPANEINSCGGTVTAVSGTGTISLVGGTAGASSLCTLSVDVVSSADGDHVNTTGDLTSSLGSSGTASDTLRVNPPPGFSKAFVPSDLPVSTVGTLVFSINNTSSTADATDLDFTDNLPADVLVADPANVVNDCSGGIVTAVAGTGVISYTGGTVLAGQSCTISVDITSDELGSYDNLTGDLTSSLGNSGTAAATLNVVDLESPAVTAVATVNGPLAACDDLRLPVSSIQVTIEDNGTPIIGADDPASYFLVGSGPDGDFDTADCAGGVAGDDQEVVVQGVNLDASEPLAVMADVSVADVQGLAAGLYRFFVCGTIEDSAGNMLDGGDFEVSFFRSNPLNLFANGHFDDCPSTVDPWTPTTTAPNVVQTGVAGTDDFASSPLSASAHFLHTDLEASSIAQCVPVTAEALYDLESWLRYDAATGALATYVQTCEFFDAVGCSGTSVGTTSIASLLEDIGATWEFSETTFHTPAGAVSAMCAFEVGAIGNDPAFNLYIDGLFLGGSNNPEIFSDGFESGNTSAWSSTVP